MSLLGADRFISMHEHKGWKLAPVSEMSLPDGHTHMPVSSLRVLISIMLWLIDLRHAMCIWMQGTFQMAGRAESWIKNSPCAIQIYYNIYQIWFWMGVWHSRCRICQLCRCCETLNISSLLLKNVFLLFMVLARGFGLYSCFFPKLHSCLCTAEHASAAHLWPCQPNKLLCEKDLIISKACFVHVRWFLGPLAVCLENHNLCVILQGIQLNRVIGQGSSEGIWLASSASRARINTLTGGKYDSITGHISRIWFAMLQNPYAILTSNK